MILSKTRIISVFLVCLASIIYVVPTFLSEETLSKWPSYFPNERIPLGLDLKGGSSILLEVDLDAFEKDRLDTFLSDVRLVLRKEKIEYGNLKVDSKTSLSMILLNGEQKQKTLTTLKGLYAGLLVTSSGSLIQMVFPEDALAKKENEVLSQSIEIVRRRIDEMGTKEPLIQRQGSRHILVQLPGVSNPQEAKDLIGKTAKLTFHMVKDSASGVGLKIEEEIEREGRVFKIPYVLESRPFVTGEMLTDAQSLLDSERGGWMVSMRFDARGAKRLSDITSHNVGQQFAIVLDGRIISAPSIQGVIPSGSAQISGNFDAKSARDLALLLRAGALPAPLKVIEERTVGPDLGADSVEMGKKATLIGSLLVFAFMFFFYGGVYGGIANLALLFNLTILLASLAVLQATLTLPGIAGIAITLGMAVDANVLIFERIKEELRKGIGLVSAIDAGFSRAMATIVDSNLTTVIVSGILYQFGTGPIRGFAVTLALGIIISMFTAVMATKVFIGMFHSVFGQKWLSFGLQVGGKSHANSK